MIDEPEERALRLTKETLTALNMKLMPACENKQEFVAFRTGWSELEPAPHHTDTEYDALEQGLRQAIENLERERDELKAKLDELNERCFSECAEPCMAYLRAELEQSKAKLDNVRNEAYSSGWNDGTRFMAKQIEHVEVELERIKAKLDELEGIDEVMHQKVKENNTLRAELEQLKKDALLKR